MVVFIGFNNKKIKKVPWTDGLNDKPGDFRGVEGSILRLIGVSLRSTILVTRDWEKGNKGHPKTRAAAW